MSIRKQSNLKWRNGGALYRANDLYSLKPNVNVTEAQKGEGEGEGEEAEELVLNKGKQKT